MRDMVRLDVVQKEGGRERKTGRGKGGGLLAYRAWTGRVTDETR